MAVEMHGMKIVMAVVDDKLDDLTVFEYEWIGIDTVNKGVGAVVADCKRSIERGHFLGQICDIIDSESGNAIDGGTLHIHREATIDGFEQWGSVIGYQSQVIVEIE